MDPKNSIVWCARNVDKITSFTRKSPFKQNSIVYDQFSTRAYEYIHILI